MREQRILYSPSGGEVFVRTADIVYRQIDGEELRLDLYRPTTDAEQPRRAQFRQP